MIFCALVNSNGSLKLTSNWVLEITVWLTIAGGVTSKTIGPTLISSNTCFPKKLVVDCFTKKPKVDVVVKLPSVILPSVKKLVHKAF